MLLDAAGTGNASETLVAARGWDMHWSYDCGAHGVFVVDVYNSDHTPDFKSPGVNEEGDNDSSTYHVDGAGRYYLEITTTCRWTVKVVESG
ncbi:MAG TPA: hypothetical protein VLK30_13345 [Candidatus Limnocylindrales bacterium]|nr:hypothetical protein [Candidatus Limnocylindrales bacterium]